MKDGEVVEGPKNIFRHGVLGCCSKPDAICCAIFLDAYICPCLVFGSMWKKTSGGEFFDFCYPCCGFFCGCLLGFFHVVPCLLICLRSNYRKGFQFFILSMSNRLCHIVYVPLDPYPKTDGVQRIFYFSENLWISLSIN